MDREERLSSAQDYIRTHGLSRSNITREHLCALYVDLKLSHDIIAEAFECSPRTIGNWLKSFGVAARSVGEARSVLLNTDFFKNWTASMAWVLGLCFTDGYFRKNQVRLALKDIEVLEKVRALVGPYLTIYKVPQPYDKSNYIYSLTFGNQEMGRDLAGLGLTGRKSLNMVFPTVPREFMGDFVRGCWDGDGGFAYNNYGKLVAHYTCGSRAFIGTLVQELFRAGIYRKQLRKADPDKEVLEKTHGKGPYPVRIHKRTGANAFDLRLVSQQQMERLSEYLYERTPSAILMERKRDLLVDYVRGRKGSQS